ncbi:DNA oxidative demethylase AlkB [Pseudomonas coleopterorum]|jgi:alkylated DNA repair protein (DNA oxidative demethylase)|uniref:DNA oxidative demethylase AlkB n=1 Tax=Pseudomonas coleopterorum TaxID=1605838 RepID=A0ABR9C126_9PSED|nr:DNA oxidative demethylase AlkB [Pseudomonas coleopterorum]MBD8753695.1 DNA oxidative demethylase AlkB [Pseudomonas coleopterorum]MBD8771003.1 DNA oxidative demethylase AlkB [Pseudomonas coleopterorum]MDF2491166.1 alpha-ketoglutarate-dependent dioxygenase [Pseudomonas sp.]
MQSSLFDDPQQPTRREALGEQTFVLRGFALPWLEEILPALREVLRAAPFRRMETPGGHTMSVALSNCGQFGWSTDARGYRYVSDDPLTGRPWPALPDVLHTLAREAAAAAGFDDFSPDACLLNRYVPGAKMSLHQDRDERDYGAPIVSVSLGLAAMFQLGGLQRSDRPLRVPLLHGDVMVWGGVDRLRFHGVLPLKEGVHPVMGPQRINFTLRKAG